MTIKYRRKVFNDIISERAKCIFQYIAPKHSIELQEWQHDLDHVHVLFKSQPKTCISKFINAYKSCSSRLIKQEFPNIKNKLWGESFWSKSFCLISTGGVNVDIIKEYIMSQG